MSIAMEEKQVELQFVVCLKNDGYDVSLEPRKIYRAVLDNDAAAHRLIRVIDESGEDYLYPVDYFAPITLPQSLVEALALAV
jgi:hypothetical protein